MAIRRLLVGATLSVIASVGLPAAIAVAAPAYPPSTGGLSVSSTTVTAGGSVHVTGTGFGAGTTVTVTVWVGGVAVDSFSVVADSSGEISTGVLLSHSGTATIVVSGVDSSGATRVLTSVVEAASVSASGSLPDTGASVRTPLVLGGALLLGGAGAILAGRRRRRRATAS
ncbi:MAG: hypothetical protein V7637_5971 [Mycobacteriales bacterium]|jgi:LPXTG-motif cell wall-anchored protein